MLILVFTMNSAIFILLVLVVDVFARSITPQAESSSIENEKMSSSNSTVASKDKYKIHPILWGLGVIDDSFSAIYGLAALGAAIYQGITTWG
ncbi:hypothetical protein ANCCAN_05704 [Ancylostoma caninum]|uniref:Nickel/cobalt efflux system n=1 Tax=Ancylostoma caninum TaxID=29170 RepID=A0A368GXT4_ANCCA|nr:hypothetical protein ANCCAN_05704 [Ancylostoma caninum]